MVACRRAIALLEDAIADMKRVIGGTPESFARRYAMITAEIYDAGRLLLELSPYRTNREEPDPDFGSTKGPKRLGRNEIRMLEFKD